MSFAKCILLLLSFQAAAHALATPHPLRHAHHRAIAARVAPPAPLDIPVGPLLKRQNTKRCRQRPSSSVLPPPSPTPSSSSVPVVVKPTTSPAAPPPPPPSPSPKKESPTQAPAPTTHVEAAPSPTPTPKASSGGSSSGSSSNLPSFLVGTQTGQGTFYATGLGACGITNSDTDKIAAVSHLLFDAFPGAGVNPNLNPVCGRKVTASYQGKSVTVTITDRCTGCALTDLDFSPSAFDELANESVGRLSGMTWVWD